MAKIRNIKTFWGDIIVHPKNGCPRAFINEEANCITCDHCVKIAKSGGGTYYVECCYE